MAKSITCSQISRNRFARAEAYLTTRENREKYYEGKKNARLKTKEFITTLLDVISEEQKECIMPIVEQQVKYDYSSGIPQLIIRMNNLLKQKGVELIDYQ